MDKAHVAPRKAGCFLAAFWLLAIATRCEAAETANPANAPATGPRADILTALHAASPHPELGDQAKVFDRLVGTWDVEYTDYHKDGGATHRSGEFVAGWILDGRALQDFWVVYPSGARKVREVYTDLHYYDAKSGTWPATFIDPEHASIARFTGGAVGNDRIVLITQDFDGVTSRWSFNEMRADSLVYREEVSPDGGTSWRPLSEFRMKRRTAVPAAP